MIAQDPAGPELALHAKIFGSEMGVEVINRLMNVIGAQAYDSNFPLMTYLSQALAYPVIEGSNTGIRRQLQDLHPVPELHRRCLHADAEYLRRDQGRQGQLGHVSQLRRAESDSARLASNPDRVPATRRGHPALVRAA